jgi:hypothetical protein
MPTTYEPFEAERFNRELAAVSASAMKAAAEDDRDQIIANIKAGRSPLGGPQKSNTTATIRRKGGKSTPLVGSKGLLLKRSGYSISKITEPGAVGFSLSPPASRADVLVYLARQGYPVFWLDSTQVAMGAQELAESMERLSNSFRGAPR